MQRNPNSHFQDTDYLEARSSVLRGSLLAVMNVEIRPGLKDKIFIHEYDNDQDLAQAFISKHSLPAKALPILLRQIKSNKMSLRELDSPRLPDSAHPSSRSAERNSFEQHTVRKEVSDRQVQMSNSRCSGQYKAKCSSMVRSKSTLDITNRLHNENLMKTKYLVQLEQRALDKMKKIKSQVNKYKPQINTISKVLASDRKNHKPIEQHLCGLGLKTSERRQRAASLQAKRQMDGCTFKPTLNKMTNRITKNRPQPTFSRALRKQSDHAYDNLFKPAFNDMSRTIMQDKDCFLTRQKEYEDVRLNNINRLHQDRRMQEIFDVNTGQQLFKPPKSSKPKVWNQNQLEVGQYLYQKGRVKQQPQVEEQRHLINRHSEQLVRNLHAKRIIWIFSELDSDQDGLISSQAINIECIPDAVLEIIMPILFEMEEFNFQLNLQEFKQALETLHKSLTTDQKGILYDYRRRK